MQTHAKAGTFETIANELIDRGEQAKAAPYLTRMTMLAELANEVPMVVLGMAKELDRLSALHPPHDGGGVSHSKPPTPANTNAAPQAGAGEAA